MRQGLGRLNYSVVRGEGTLCVFGIERCRVKFLPLKELPVFVVVDCLNSQWVIVRDQTSMQVHCRGLKNFEVAGSVIYIPELVV